MFVAAVIVQRLRRGNGGLRRRSGVGGRGLRRRDRCDVQRNSRGRCLPVVVVTVVIPCVFDLASVMTGVRLNRTVMVGACVGRAMMVAMALTGNDAHRRCQRDDTDCTE